MKIKLVLLLTLHSFIFTQLMAQDCDCSKMPIEKKECVIPCLGLLPKEKLQTEFKLSEPLADSIVRIKNRANNKKIEDYQIDISQLNYKLLNESIQYYYLRNYSLNQFNVSGGTNVGRDMITNNFFYLGDTSTLKYSKSEKSVRPARPRKSKGMAEEEQISVPQYISLEKPFCINVSRLKECEATVKITGHFKLHAKNELKKVYLDVYFDKQNIQCLSVECKKNNEGYFETLVFIPHRLTDSLNLQFFIAKQEGLTVDDFIEFQRKITIQKFYSPTPPLAWWDCLNLPKVETDITAPITNNGTVTFNGRFDNYANSCFQYRKLHGPWHRTKWFIATTKNGRRQDVVYELENGIYESRIVGTNGCVEMYGEIQMFFIERDQDKITDTLKKFRKLVE